jgi:hypothetical protein
VLDKERYFIMQLSVFPLCAVSPTFPEFAGDPYRFAEFVIQLAKLIMK